MRGQLIRWLVMAGIIVLDIFWATRIPWFHVLLSPTAIIVLVLTVIDGWVVGAVSAAVIGSIYAYVSVLGGWSMGISLLGVVAATWLVSRRVVASRATLSFLATVAIGTAVGALVFIGCEAIFSFLNHDRLHAVASAVLAVSAIHVITHPIIISIYWRLSRRHYYGRVTSAWQRTF